MDDKKSVATVFYHAFNANDGAIFDQILAANWINHPADPGQPNTPEGFKRAVQQTHAALEGFHIEIEAMVAEGDLVVCRIAMQGRHVGDIEHRKASGRQVSFSGMDMHRIVDGRILETWHFENYDGLNPELAVE